MKQNEAQCWLESLYLARRSCQKRKYRRSHWRESCSVVCRDRRRRSRERPGCTGRTLSVPVGPSSAGTPPRFASGLGTPRRVPTTSLLPTASRSSACSRAARVARFRAARRFSPSCQLSATRPTAPATVSPASPFVAPESSADARDTSDASASASPVCSGVLALAGAGSAPVSRSATQSSRPSARSRRASMSVFARVFSGVSGGVFASSQRSLRVYSEKDSPRSSASAANSSCSDSGSRSVVTSIVFAPYSVAVFAYRIQKAPSDV